MLEFATWPYAKAYADERYPNAQIEPHPTLDGLWVLRVDGLYILEDDNAEH